MKRSGVITTTVIVNILAHLITTIWGSLPCPIHLPIRTALPQVWTRTQIRIHLLRLSLRLLHRCIK